MADNTQLYKKLSGLESVPTETSSSVLESLALIDKLQKTKFESSSLGFIAKNELRYLQLGAEAVTNDPTLRMIYGDDFDGIQRLAKALKARDEERRGMASLDHFLSKQNESDISPAELALRKTAGSAISDSQ